MFALPFVRNALLAGSLIAVASGLLGYFIVLRAQVFAGDALSHFAFTGALAAAAVGADASPASPEGAGASRAAQSRVNRRAA